MAKIGITETVLRDAHQSLIATRMRTDEFEDILEKMDKIGYHSLECWGGATFDSCLRFLDEDPWDRLRLIRKKCPNTKLQMLFRGQNMLGYRHYSDELVDYFVKKSSLSVTQPITSRAERQQIPWRTVQFLLFEYVYAFCSRSKKPHPFGWGRLDPCTGYGAYALDAETLPHL